MRTAILVAAFAATVAVGAAPMEKVAFTKPLWDRPIDIQELGEAWPKAPTFASPLLRAETPPKVVVMPAPGQAPPEENHLHRGPDSEEWHCLVPLQDEQAPVTGKVTPNRCQTPSLEPGDLLHLL